MSETITVHVPMTFRRRGGRKLIVTPDGSTMSQAASPSQIDSVLVKALVRSFRWQRPRPWRLHHHQGTCRKGKDRPLLRGRYAAPHAACTGYRRDDPRRAAATGASVRMRVSPCCLIGWNSARPFAQQAEQGAPSAYPYPICVALRSASNIVWQGAAESRCAFVRCIDLRFCEQSWLQNLICKLSIRTR